MNVRWETSDRGLRYYADAEGHTVHESSSAESPHLWIDGENTPIEDAAALRDKLDPGPWRETLTVAIEQHYQHRPLTKDWKAGDPCHNCGSTDTTLDNDIAACNGCGSSEDATNENEAPK